MATMTAIKLDGNLYRDEIFADLATRVQAHQGWRLCWLGMIQPAMHMSK